MYPTIKLGKINTSKIELIDITKAWLAISLAFALVYSGASLLGGDVVKIFSVNFLLIFLVSLFTAGLGFLLHELAHKFSAQHYGCTAEFRAFDQMLYLAVGLAALVGFIFAAPGIISLAGPLTNYVIALIFYGLNYLVPTLGFIFLTGFTINLWLGLFNLIPFGNFDGIKIFHWSTPLWLGMVVFGLGFMFGI